MVKVGQRYSYTNYGSTAIRFIVEVIACKDSTHTDVKIVQKIDWSSDVGYIYYNQNLLGDTEYWHYLEGQDKPEA